MLSSIRRVAAALLVALLPALAWAQVEVSFYYPVAVGGPITKIIDGFAADFEKENPGVKIRPIYSGSYQESITKALTAVKSGEPPVTSILLSTDMFTLIDEDAIVPFDEIAKSADDQAWVKSFYPAFMENSQTGGKTWGIPFQRSTIVLYWNKELFKEAGLDRDQGLSPTDLRLYEEAMERLVAREARMVLRVRGGAPAEELSRMIEQISPVTERLLGAMHRKRIRQFIAEVGDGEEPSQA